MQPIVVSEQLALMPLELRDADELFELTDRNRPYLRHWLPWLDNITRPEDSRAFIRAAQAQGSQNNGTQLAIRLNGRITGIVGHHQIDWRNRLTSLGYWVGEEFQGRGAGDLRQPSPGRPCLRPGSAKPGRDPVRDLQ